MTAPAPSPNNTQVSLSVQSIIRDKVSAPTTSALLAAPVFINLSATLSAYIKPVHTACISKAAEPRTPKRSCNKQAVLGKTRSGVVVATIIKSTSSALTEAASIAIRAACSARSQVISSSAAMCLLTTPVLLLIHSSEVSTICSSSALSIIRSGK